MTNTIKLSSVSAVNSKDSQNIAKSLDSLAALFASQPLTREFRAALQNHRETCCSGVARPARPLIMAAINNGLIKSWPILWITPSVDSAERLCQDLDAYNPQLHPLLFPEKENLSVVGEESNGADPARLAILQTVDQYDRTPREQPLVITAPILALLQPTVRIERLQQGKISIKRGESIDLEILLEMLVSEGYKRTTMVERRGEFAVRGCVVDIYPITEDPVRFELFGDEIESMRHFNIATQRSTEDIKEAELLPASEGVEEGAWLTDYLAKKIPNCLIVLEEPTQLRLTAQEWYQEWSPDSTDSTHSIWDKVAEMFAPFRRLYLTSWAGTGWSGMDAQPVDNFEFSFELAAAFPNRVEEMLQTLPQWQADGKRVVILSNQYLRLQELFKEHDINGWTTIQDSAPKPGEVLLLPGYASEGFKIPLQDGDLVFLTDREIVGQRLRRRAGKPADRGTKLRLDELTIGDFVVHIQHGIGRYAGVMTIAINSAERDMLVLEYANNSKVYVPIEQLDLVEKYQGTDDKAPKLSRIGKLDWQNTKNKIRQQTREIAEQLLRLYAIREQIAGHAYPVDTPWQQEMEDSFPYQETPDQLRAILEVKEDLQSTHPMDRLICGDVGYGKTEVALRACFKVVEGSKQVAILVPTTVLAHQHYLTFRERFASYPITVKLLSRFRTAKEQKETLQGLEDGSVDIVIGTHRLLSKDIKFKDLGLLVVDEEHKFGVTAKERLRELRNNVDTLTMSATPIPRTLQMSFFGIREMSVIETPPAARLPIKTYLFDNHPELIKACIARELAREGQVYFVHNRVQGLARVAKDIQQLLPQARVVYAHGQMEEGKLEQIMMDFFDHQYDVLVCTTIIESGLDIPNVNTIIINNAHMFGLAQLYQLRGRVGRSSKQGYCYLLNAPNRKLTEEAEKRLETIRDFTHLGAGYQVARRDLEIRGAGNILGAEQSGHVAEVGFSLYCSMLNEAVENLKEGKTEVVEEKSGVVIDLPVPAALPDSYISDAGQKVALYRRIAKLTGAAEVEEIKEELRDRFGELPPAAVNLLNIVKIKLLGMQLKLQSAQAKAGNLILTFAYYPQISLRQREKLAQISGWIPRPEKDKLRFEGLFGRAAGNVHYPPAETIINNLHKILTYLLSVSRG